MSKIEGNVSRDTKNTQDLVSSGWRVAIVWECALRGESKEKTEKLIEDLANWLKTKEPRFNFS